MTCAIVIGEYLSKELIYQGLRFDYLYDNITNYGTPHKVGHRAKYPPLSDPELYIIWLVRSVHYFDCYIRVLFGL